MVADMESSDEIVLRAALSADIVQIADLRWRLKTEDADIFDPREKEAFLAAFEKDQAASTNYSHWVADNGGQVVAVMSVGLVAKLLSPGRSAETWGYLTNCYTLPAWRRRGIGSRLLAAIIGEARGRGMELMIVWPSDQSYSFYERLGFERTRDPLVLHL